MNVVPFPSGELRMTRLQSRRWLSSDRPLSAIAWSLLSQVVGV
jgi:hypothetical protein